MKDGDLVVGKTIVTDGPEKLPAQVCGKLELAEGNIGEEKWKLILVYVNDSDGDELPVECSAVRTANRGEKMTVLS